MSESPATQVGHFPSPKSQALVEIVNNGEKRPSLSDIISPNNEFEHDSKDHKSSTNNFISSLKSFNIDKSKYRHYGTSLSSNSLDHIINDDSKKDNHNKFIVDDFISLILNIPKQTISDESIWPYDIQTLNEVLQYKIEQERTKQESIKSEVCNVSLQMLQLAKSMDLSHDLIASLFLSTEADLIKLKSRLFDLQNCASMNNHTRIHGEPMPSHTTETTEVKPELQKTNSSSALNNNNNNNNNNKHKHSDTQLPSFSETAQSIKSNGESPNKLPKSSHRRITSTSSTSSSKESRHPTPPPNPIQLPTPQQHRQLSPPMPANVYQIYYGPPVDSTPANPSVLGQGLGSPYSQKYPSVLYQPPPPGSQYQGYVVPQYQYFVPSPTSNANNVAPSQQYVVKSSPTVLPPPVPPVPSHQFQSTDGDNSRTNIFRTAEIPDDTHPSKKQKSNSKNTSINFMITTPKNPPARKYNNTHKDK